MSSALQARLTIIDVQPDSPQREAAQLRALSQCAECSFRPFLASQPELERYWGLEPLVRLFEALPRLADAIARSDGEAVAGVALETGARSCLQLTPPGARPGLALPRLAVVDLATARASDLPRASAERDCAWMMMMPAAGQTERLPQQIEVARRLGYRGVWLGHYEHTVMAERWSDFCDPPDLDERWRELCGLQQRGIALGVALPYPPCALLQAAQNRPLEALRARLDLYFRRLDGDLSRMCPENVSGYALVNDVRDMRAPLQAAQHRLAVRFEDVLVLY